MIYTVGTYKGGPGKTTTAAALADYIAGQSKKKTLVIDLNSQGNLSLAMAARGGRSGTIVDALQGKRYTPQKVKDHLYILPAAPELERVSDPALIEQTIRAAAVDFYNVVIDTPPEDKAKITGALAASGSVVIPVIADPYGVQGFLQIVATIKQIQRQRPKLSIAGVFLNMYNGRVTVDRICRDAIIKAADGEGVPYLGEVPRGVAVVEAALLQLPLFDHKPNSKPAEGFKAVFDKFAKV